MASQYTTEYLKELQGYPLEIKIQLTKQRIREWVHKYGEDGVYVSFSGGKDSTVLLHLVREMYGDVIPGVFVDTGLEYPEIREFVRTFDNIVWLKPKKNFRKVIEDYGYPFISKEVSERVYYAQKYLTWYRQQNSLDRPTDYSLRGSLNLESKKTTETIPDNILQDFVNTGGKGTYKIREMIGCAMHNGKPSLYNYSRYKWLIMAPFMISNKCCDVMKKAPLHSYQKKTGRNGMTAQMASESRLRTRKWLQNGCNGFNMKNPISNPMAFWTEQDVLLYIYQNQIPIASVYGEVIKENEVDGQLDFADIGLFDLGRPILKTTGCDRTGCMFCGYGCHLEPEGEGRFERLKVTHPKIYDYIMRPWEQGGLNYKEVIDWINEHGDLHIRY